MSEYLKCASMLYYKYKDKTELTLLCSSLADRCVGVIQMPYVGNMSDTHFETNSPGLILKENYTRKSFPQRKGKLVTVARACNPST